MALPQLSPTINKISSKWSRGHGGQVNDIYMFWAQRKYDSDQYSATRAKYRRGASPIEKPGRLFHLQPGTS